jgi:exodeoxyribonuclease VII small subunit
MDMEQLSFEEAYAQLEAVVGALRNGQMPLDQALERYQEGMKLVQYCNELLQKAQLSVQQLNVAADGSLTLEEADIP